MIATTAITNNSDQPISNICAVDAIPVARSAEHRPGDEAAGHEDFLARVLFARAPERGFRGAGAAGLCSITFRSLTGSGSGSSSPSCISFLKLLMPLARSLM